MSILTHDDIVKEMNLGNIRFHPRISPDQIKEASVDLHLSEFFRVFEKINQVVEITNLSPNILMLKEGERICQLVFQRTSGNSVYKGRFKSQNRP